MSVHVIAKANNGATHEVRWRTLAGEQRAARFESSEDAAGFDDAVRARAALERAQAAWEAVPDRWKRHVQRRHSELL